MSTGHTTAPWKIGSNDGELRIYGEREDGLPLGEVYTIYIDEDEAKANARLIAASPNLLAAARMALDVLNEHLDYDDDDGSSEAEASNALLAAIAEAEGKSIREIASALAAERGAV